MKDKEKKNHEDKFNAEETLKISKKLPKAYILQGCTCARCDAGSTCVDRGSLGCC